MDCSQYYEKEYDGRFHVVFRNATGISVDEIQRIFSQYGKVLGVNCSGDLKGHRFVKFATEADAVNCVKKLANHEFIALLPKKPRKNKEALQNQQKEKATNVTTSNSIVRNNQQSHYTTVESSESKSNGKSAQSMPPKNAWKCLNLKSSSESLNISSTSLNKQVTDIHKTGTILPLSQEDLRKSFTEYPELVPQKCVTPRKYINANEKDDDNSDICIEDSLPQLITADNSSEITLSSRSTSITDLSERYKHVVVAENIVVANIPANIGIFYILHLFEKYDPIGASLMKKVPRTNIRYCHIYFKTIQQALLVEENFDNFPLCDKTISGPLSTNLIVCRVSSLLHEAEFL